MVIFFLSDAIIAPNDPPIILKETAPVFAFDSLDALNHPGGESPSLKPII